MGITFQLNYAPEGVLAQFLIKTYCPLHMNTDPIHGLALQALALNEPISDIEKESARLRAQVGVLREIARRMADRVGRPGPGKATRAF